GVFPAKCRMQTRLAALGYVEVQGTGQNSILASGEIVRGHQFRYSTIDQMPDSIGRAYELRKPSVDGQIGLEGYTANNCLASYVHLHFLSNPTFAERWVDLCRAGVTT
ncbi:MAG TPA: cobyrinic acid a,c-diamide synthase, partial [Blastocatellia bacterium]